MAKQTAAKATAKKKVVKKKPASESSKPRKSTLGNVSEPMCDLTLNPAKRAQADKMTASVKDTLPAGLSQPALRALARAGYTSVAQLARVDDAELLKMHGFGPKGIKTIRAALGSNA
ncbi:MAG TPA: helix-hairpin-helix domain-containing protein [Pirellulales bacterium]|nr:helix-hairpin-helix domain-containing protein [Pirellulales bacterium]